MSLHPVTDHALWRWMQRVRGIGHLVEALAPNGSSDSLRAAIGCRILCLTDAGAIDLVCPPRLHAGMRIGDGCVHALDRMLWIRDGRVVTCQEQPVAISSHRARQVHRV